MSDGWQRNAVLGIMGSLMAFNFYGGIDSTSTNKSQDKEIVQMKGELRDLWEKYNENAKEKGELGMKAADYMIDQEIRHGAIEKEVSRVELENKQEWLDYYKGLQ